jgi:hypothetical protein
MKKLSKVIMAGIAGLMLMSGPASGGPRELAVFHVDIDEEWDMEADLDSDPINVARKNSNNEIIFEDCDPVCGVPFILGAFWTEDTDTIYANGTNGSECFPPNLGGTDLRHSVLGTIHLKVMKQGQAKATFSFTAKLDDGDGDANGNYQLKLFDDEGWRDNDGQRTAFPPPDINDTITMTFDPDDLWEMETEGRGKARHTACKGVGMDAEVTIVLTRIS